MMESTLPRKAARKRHRRDGPAAVHGPNHSGRAWPRIAARTAVAAVALAALVSLSALASSGSTDAKRTAVVMDRAVAQDPARRAAAAEWLQSQGAANIAPRITNSPTQELAVTSALAVRGYDVIVAVGLDQRVAIDPVVRRYPDLRVVSR
jgi:basic membrane lipoprotein Med (substrate-binding protein (PBP1-ABC) superfamily)